MPTTAASFGVDLDLVTDLTPEMREVSGITVLQQGLARRLDCPRGWLIDDPDYGLDVAGRMSDTLTEAAKFRLGVEVQAEVKKDQRVLTADVSAAFTGPPPSTKLKLSVDGDSVDGPYSLTLGIDGLTVEVLEDGQ